MPGRIEPLVTNEIYHVFNLGVAHCSTFIDKRDYQRFIELINFYQFPNPPMRFSHFLLLSNERRSNFIMEVSKKDQKLIKLINYCLMPNHFHFLLQQTYDGGISKFLANLQNSYTKYFNVKQSRIGSLFLDQFKAIRIETEEQLIHVSRYIHLNPYTGFVVKNLEELEKYPWFSFNESSLLNGNICQKESVLSLFKNPEYYKQFVFDQAGYQRELGIIKHLLMER